MGYSRTCLGRFRSRFTNTGCRFFSLLYTVKLKTYQMKGLKRYGIRRKIKYFSSWQTLARFYIHCMRWGGSIKLFWLRYIKRKSFLSKHLFWLVASQSRAPAATCERASSKSDLPMRNSKKNCMREEKLWQ